MIEILFKTIIISTRFIIEKNCLRFDHINLCKKVPGTEGYLAIKPKARMIVSYVLQNLIMITFVKLTSAKQMLNPALLAMSRQNEDES